MARSLHTIRFPRLPALSASFAALTLLLLPVGAAAADEAVSISGFAFHPATVTVNVGDAVTWTNNDGVSHTATANNGAFDTEAIGTGSSASVTFSTAGSFGYHCEIHPTMHGTVVVRSTSGGVPGTDTISPQAPGSGDGLGNIALLLGSAVGVLVGLRVLRRRSRSG
jgi:plastocyanin